VDVVPITVSLAAPLRFGRLFVSSSGIRNRWAIVPFAICVLFSVSVHVRFTSFELLIRFGLGRPLPTCLHSPLLFFSSSSSSSLSVFSTFSSASASSSSSSSASSSFSFSTAQKAEFWRYPLLHNLHAWSQYHGRASRGIQPPAPP